MKDNGKDSLRVEPRYEEVYQDLVYERNEAIRWLGSHHLLSRDRNVESFNEEEWARHKMAELYRKLFRRRVLGLLDGLYQHDAVEAVYDFNSIELGGWTDTEANRLERELQRLQLIIGKLETRYDLRYQLVFEYIVEECTLYLNMSRVFSCGQSTLRHRLLATIFSNPQSLWDNEDIEQYFIRHFGYSVGQLTDKSIEKAAKDIQKDIASKTAVRDVLIVSGASVRINPSYLH